IILIFQISFGQSFEGKITYSVDFQLDEEKFSNMGVTKEIIVDRMKEEGDFYDKITYYFKEGNYVKIENSTKKKDLFINSTKIKSIFLKLILIM
ncbi:MAG: hypothetical protein AAGG68_20150, partial [Bacteroidota bacterium]